MIRDHPMPCSKERRKVTSNRAKGTEDVCCHVDLLRQLFADLEGEGGGGEGSRTPKTLRV